MVATNLFDERRRAVMIAAAKRWKAQPPTPATTQVTPSEQARYDARRSSFDQASELKAQGRLPVFVERKMGPTLDWYTLPPDDAARAAGRPVARIVANVDPKVDPVGFATGFMVSPNVLLTNWHVFPDPGSVRGTGANFLHDETASGVARGIIFEFDPDALFFSAEDLDFALVAVKPKAITGELLSSVNFLAINGSRSKILPGMPIRMIEYPDGGPKRYAMENCRLLELREDGFLRYETDTEEGSSGSACYSEMWEVVGLHHASIPKMRGNTILNKDGSAWSPGQPDDGIDWIANEGVRISALVKAFGGLVPTTPASKHLLDELLANTTDPTDEVEKLATPRAPEALSPVLPDPSKIFANTKGNVMGGVTMNFSGPVTIFVGSGVPASQLPQATAAVAADEALEKALRFDPNYDDREGYNPDFLENDITVPLPRISQERDQETYKENGQIVVLKYHHFSLAMNASRRMQMWSAVNVDYDASKRTSSGRAFFGQDRWVVDPRIPQKYQLGDPDIYAPAKQIDRGHIVRREDNAWGDTPTEIEFANSDTFHFSNCTPQHAAFNRSQPGKQWPGVQGLWGGFENHIQRDLQSGDTRACIIAGPILNPNDPSEDFGTGPVQYPLVFWKVVAVSTRDTNGRRSLRTYGFRLSQKDVVDRFGVEFAPGEYARYQVALSAISDEAGVIFDDVLLRADTHADA
ncbi:hypothetical protein CN311_15640 [Mesorhizobium sanjuanii]|uniref:Serine protease n=1 Tax=Mesorhizobium sanjuanii TaxID=2037900 RepID=A0A2A6FE59_9HYPH|nr:DNA/RNA non-specific endonuclease [Mesorhizobium sanjuanii]PDQ20124.1 hypothetical protein CN311_15640 [Mesorhizobium sanjuanii]